MIASRPAIKKDIISADLENEGKRTPFAKIAVSEQLYNRFLPNFHRNDGNVVGKKVISADLENAGHDRQL